MPSQPPANTGGPFAPPCELHTSLRTALRALIVSPSSGIPMMGQLLDVMSEAIELPLPIHLAAASQGEAIKPLVPSQVAEHGLHGGKAPSDHLPAELRIDPRLSQI